MPEIDQRSIAHVTRYKPIESRHNTGYASLISNNDFPQILGIELGAKHCRANQIDEHDRQLPTFGKMLTIPRGSGIRGVGRLGYERRATIRAEFLARRVLIAAGRTFDRKGRSAVAAKALSVRDVRPAPRAKHAVLP